MFKLSQKADYGLILLSSIAKQDVAGPVTTFLPASAQSSQPSEPSRPSKPEALRAVGIPSSRATRKPIPISLIARKHKISVKFLSQVAQELKKAGLLMSKEGVSGGYMLAKKPDKIKLLDVLKILEGELVEGKCFEEGHECTCGAGEMWQQMKEQMEATLGKKTVADLVISR